MARGEKRSGCRPWRGVVGIGASAPAELVRRHLLDRFAPASVLVDGDFRILYFHGLTEDFLVQPRGEPRQLLLAMARPGLRSPIRRAVREAAASPGEPAAVEARLRADGRALVRVVAQAVTGRDAREPLNLVSFERLPASAAAAPPRRRASPKPRSRSSRGSSSRPARTSRARSRSSSPRTRSSRRRTRRSPRATRSSSR